jgi:hypothetical protein
VNQNLRSRWVLANALGFTVGGALAGGVARALEEPHVGITSSGRGALVSAMRSCEDPIEIVPGQGAGVAQLLERGDDAPLK